MAWAINLVTVVFIVSSLYLAASKQKSNDVKNLVPGLKQSKPVQLQPCTCGVFLSGQFKKGSREPPTGHPAIVTEQDRAFQCTQRGIKQCQNKCLETIVRHLPNSHNLICATVDRNCYKERAYLFVKNCNKSWHNTNFSAGKEYCCKNGTAYQCPFI